ncbi:MAG TPA: hypothetical protein VE907_23560 [Gammaproteobacteria bacterium]|nr:hypothetical protein [Gammaproteobacteria bacterium]
MATTNKKKRESVITAVAIVLGAAVSQPAAPQGSERLTVDVHDCLSLEKRDERLACFEAQVEAAQRAAPARGSEPVAPSPAPAATAAPAPSAPPAAAGTAAAASTAASAESGKPARAKSGSEQAPAEIVAKVAELRETVPNAYLITLDNGQVWRQSQPAAYPLRPGLEVRLRQTRFGYRLTAPELRGQIQVDRVR